MDLSRERRDEMARLRDLLGPAAYAGLCHGRMDLGPRTGKTYAAANAADAEDVCAVVATRDLAFRTHRLNGSRAASDLCAPFDDDIIYVFDSARLPPGYFDHHCPLIAFHLGE
ncbi:hypothetical protein T31B1_19572 [Salinisphaera sp. T31B1]